MKKWKWLFFGLLSLNFILVLIFFVFIVMPSQESVPLKQIDNFDEKRVEMKVNTNKADVTKVINHYIEKELDTSKINYKVLLTEKVLLVGKISILGNDLDLVMTFEPTVLDDGNLLLTQESITLGQLNIPVSFVLNYIRDNYSLPDWITISAKEKTVHANLGELKLKSNMAVNIESFNLKEDQLAFKILIPVK